jgi:hypothetical protein
MTPIQTALIFVGAPAAIMLFLAALVYGASSRRSPRYRPGRAFTFAPVWFVAAERAAALDGRARSRDEHAAVEARFADGTRPPALTADANAAPAAQHKGGARGTW